jgi:hypothetical protein
MPKAVWFKCLPISLWPPTDRAAWEAAMRPNDPFEDAGLATRWSAATRRKTARGYGRFLCWLVERHELDMTADPAARITRERLTSYLDELRRAIAFTFGGLWEFIDRTSLPLMPAAQRGDQGAALIP